jgi:hypothetical protein
MSGKQLILLGFGGVLVGAALPFLMVIRVIEPSFLLSLVAFLLSVSGLIMGLIGSALYVSDRRRR